MDSEFVSVKPEEDCCALLAGLSLPQSLGERLGYAGRKPFHCKLGFKSKQVLDFEDTVDVLAVNAFKLILYSVKVCQMASVHFLHPSDLKSPLSAPINTRP